VRGAFGAKAFSIEPHALGGEELRILLLEKLVFVSAGLFVHGGGVGEPEI
jgi:hypothetical protein